jgi:3-oxoacyl-[acyl-carrier protein] reductase
MKDGGRIIMVGSAVGERAVAPGLVPYAATKGVVKMFTGAIQGGREPGHYGQQRPAGSDRHRFESRLG